MTNWKQDFNTARTAHNNLKELAEKYTNDEQLLLILAANYLKYLLAEYRSGKRGEDFNRTKERWCVETKTYHPEKIPGYNSEALQYALSGDKIFIKLANTMTEQLPEDMHIAFDPNYYPTNSNDSRTDVFWLYVKI